MSQWWDLVLGESSEEGKKCTACSAVSFFLTGLQPSTVVTKQNPVTVNQTNCLDVGVCDGSGRATCHPLCF